MDGSTREALIDVAKRKCRITWDDDDTDERIAEIVENTVEALRHRLGMGDVAPDVFLKPGATKLLFENQCLYDWNNMLEEFETNYKKEILAVRHRYEVENAKEE